MDNRNIRQAENNVRIEGLLSEIDLTYHEYNSNGSPQRAIRGMVKIRVDQMINNEPKTLEIPVFTFAPEITRSGKKNPAFESMERVMTTYVSIAAAGEGKADRVRITNGEIRMNEYYNAEGRLISFPRINASFINKVGKDEFKPTAIFEVEFVVNEIGPELDREDNETGRLLIKGILPQYGNTIDLVEFYAENPKVISVIEGNWTPGNTVAAVGKLNFSTSIRSEEKETDFGEPIMIQRTVSVSEMIITGGTRDPITGEKEYQKEDIQYGITQRKVKLEAQKEKDMARVKAKAKAPSQDSGTTRDLGF